MHRIGSLKAVYYIVVTVIFANAGVIHPQLAEKLKTLKDNEPIQVIVHMKNQADLSAMQRATKADKIVYLQQYVDNYQADLLSYLMGLGDKVTNLKSWWIFNGLTFCATKAVIEAVDARSDVDYVIDNFAVHIERDFELEGETRTPGVSWGVKQTGADDCWDDGYDGTGIIVGNIDSGVDVDHPAFHGRWVPGGWFDAVNDSANPYDDYGHGTATMGTMCGGDGLGPDLYDAGMAPGANFICAKIRDSYGNSNLTWIHNAMQWFAAQNVNICLGEWVSSRLSTAFWDDCQNLRSLGIYVVFPIGNSGPNPWTDRTPGNYPIVTGVGATDQFDNIAGWSSRGPAPNQSPWSDTTYWERPDWNLTKPDISAPGVGLPIPISIYFGGGYAAGWGTSFSGPTVAGAVAILLQRDSTLSYNEIYNILLNSADHPPQGAPYPNNNYGWGRLNVYSALYAIPGWTVPNIALRQVNIINDNNANGKLDPGEAADIICTVKNIGASSATNLQSTLRTSSSYITITDSLYTFGTINAGDSADNTSDPFSVLVDSITPVGTLIDFELYLVSAETTWARIFTKKIGTSPGDIIWGPKNLTDITALYRQICGIAYDRVGNQIFVLNYNDGYIRIYSADSMVDSIGQWCTAPDYRLTDIAYSDYDDNLWLTSNNLKQVWKISKSGAVLRQFTNPANDYPIGLTFYNNVLYCADQRTNIGDTSYIYISDTLGNATQYVNPVQGRRNAHCLAFDTCGNSYVQTHIWHTGVGFYQDSVGVVEYQGEPPTLTGNRFRFPEGWYTRGIEFDPRDGNYWITLEYLNQIIKVKGFYDVTTGVSEVKPPKSVRNYAFNIAQNPIASRLTCQFSIPTRETVNLDIYDIAGRLVCRLVKDHTFDSGSHSRTWNLKDEMGKDIACGVYFLMFELKDYKETKKLILLR